MRYKTVKGPIKEIKASLLVLGRFADTPLDIEEIEKILTRRKFRSELGKTEFINAQQGFAAKNILVVGLGKPWATGTDCYRVASATALRRAKDLAMSDTALVFPKDDSGAQSTGRWMQAIVEGCELGLYRFVKYFSEKENATKRVREVKIHFEGREKDIADAIQKGLIFAKWTIFARDLISEPADYLTPEQMASIAKREGKKEGLKVKVINAREAKKLGMGGLVGVGKGSVHPPCLIHISYRAPRKRAPRIGILGKGLTFDSGGLSIKTGKYMELMKDDMAGSAAVLAVMLALPTLKPNIHVEGVMVMAENMPSGNAMRPGDVIRMMNKKTVEVINTDAEGRLVLADGLVYLQEKKVSAIVDLATLTGSCVVALGEKCAGIMGTDQELMDALIKASKQSGEMIAQLPLIEDYRESLKSPIADIKNVSSDGWAGTITAALFLSEFVNPETRWAHLDIAGPSYTAKDTPLAYTGGTGFGVRTLLHFLTNEELASTARSANK